MERGEFGTGLIDGGLIDGGTRGRQLDEIAEALPQRASALSRIFLTRTSICVSRTEVGVLRILSAGPRRITELASIERVTQPAITLLVNRLAERGWVERVSDPTDGRAVLVSLTSSGADAFAQLRQEYRQMLHAEMAMLCDEDVDTLARSVEILDELIERLTEHEA
jgi:DNA-binding MarR family transcriptional regulator